MSRPRDPSRPVAGAVGEDGQALVVLIGLVVLVLMEGRAAATARLVPP